MLNHIKSAPAGRIIVYRDEKNFNVGEYYNCRNSRYVLLEGHGDVPHEVRYATSTKMCRGFDVPGCSGPYEWGPPPIRFSEKERLNSARYVKILDKILLSWMAKVAAKHPVGIGDNGVAIPAQ